MRNKIFTRIIITTLLCAFLTFSVGKVTRVSAVGTTAAIAGTAFLLTGAVYLSYVALTQGEMILPAAEDMHEWLGSIGRKVSQYPSGASAYQDIYQGLLRDPTANVIDGVWTWTQDRLKSFANDFADTRIIADITQYVEHVQVEPNNGFDYTSVISITDVPFQAKEDISNPVYHDFSYWYERGYDLQPQPGINMVIGGYLNNGYCVQPTTLTGTYRNYFDGSRYKIQQLINDTWSDVSINAYFGYWCLRNNYYWYAYPTQQLDGYWLVRNANSTISIVSGALYNYPVLPNEVIYDSTTDENLPMVIPDSDVLHLPQWVDPDNNNRPIIPWVPIPQLPANIPTPSGYNGVSQWGFNLQDLLDKLEELAGQLIDIGGIAGLINEFAGLHGDNYYLEYNDGDTNYYTYYQPTIFDNDTEYITYNIDITDEQDKIPVDLNTIQLYTNNRYLAQIKESAVNGSTMLRDLAVFWYDVDPEVTYIVFGCCILILIGAFTGKLGHS